MSRHTHTHTGIYCIYNNIGEAFFCVFKVKGVQLQLLVCGRNPKNLLEKKKKGEKIEGKKKKVFDFFLLILSLSPF
jgi:hypothetical protein